MLLYIPSLSIHQCVHQLTPTELGQGFDYDDNIVKITVHEVQRYKSYNQYSLEYLKSSMSWVIIYLLKFRREKSAVLHS